MLAAGALVASLLAVVGASPAAAASGTADVKPDWQACFGPATESADFVDVAEGGAHYKNIQCLAHYDITTGRMGGTEFAPRDTVTRSQMALFLARAADAAGIDLGSAMAHKFTDIGDLDAERVSAISRLTAKNIMTAPKDDTFDPHGTVSRADMAEYLVALLAASGDPNDGGPDGLKRDKKTLLYTFDEATFGADRDDDTLDNDLHDEKDNFFTDVYTMTSPPTANAIYTAFELGITTGYQDKTFKPNNAVSRQEMASFIMRAMAHTNLRPSGLSAQRAGSVTTGWLIQASMRNADFEPVANTPVDVFSTNWPDSAFDADGMCVTRPFDRINDIGTSPNKCEIDVVDMVTDEDGNAEYDTTAPGSDPDDSDALTVTCSAAIAENGTAGTYTIQSASDAIKADTTIYAWTGKLGDEVDDETDLVEVEVTSTVLPDRAAEVPVDHALVTGGLDTTMNQRKAHFGDTVTWTLQLRGLDTSTTPATRINTTPDDSGNKYNLVDSRAAANTTFYTVPSQVVPDENGMATISITQAERVPDDSTDEADVIVSLILSPATDNTAGTGDGTTPDTTAVFATTANQADLSDSPLTLTVTFSEADALAENHVIQAKSNSVWDWTPSSGSYGGNSVTITVVDEYGDPVRGHKVGLFSNQNNLTADPQVINSVFHRGLFSTGRSGSYTIGYSFGSPVANTETLTVTGPDGDDSGDDPDLTTSTATMYWASAGRLTEVNSANAVLHADAGADLFVVTSSEAYTGAPSSAPHVYSYDDVDTFKIQTEQVSMEQFEAAINSTKVKVVGLLWSGYQWSRPVDRSTWTINLACDA